MSASGPPPGDPPPIDRRSGALPVASGKSLDQVEVVGRERELAALGRLLSAARAHRSGALLVVGEPGIGKTTLLDRARDLADGFVCLTARGVESEAVLAHAGLLELVMPIRSLLADLPGPQAAALSAALGWDTPTAPTDRFLVAAATLSLLAAAATSTPVLVVVDDLQWLDRESAAAILFAVRRLGQDAVAFVLSARPGSLSSDLVPGIPVLPLAGLAPPEACRLLPRHTTHAVAAELVERTEGNPLALMQASWQLDRAQLVGAARLPDPLPVGDRILDHYLALVGDLSPAARRAVSLFALTQGSEATAVVGALSAEHVDPAAALDEACDRGVLVADERGWHFSHPLLRSAVRRLAGPAGLRHDHRALAAQEPAGSPTRVWHLAASALGADDDLAEELVGVAAAERRRMGFAAAAAAMEQAAALTSRGDDLKARRLAQAAEDAFLAGDVTRTRALAARVLVAPAASARGQALFTLGMLEQYAGSVPASVEHLGAACGLLEGPRLVRALAEPALAAFRLNDFAAVGQCAARLDEAADRSDPEQGLLVDLTVGVSLVLRGDPVAGAEKLAGARALAMSRELRIDPRTLAIRASGRAWLDDHDGAFADAGEAADLGDLLGYVADAVRAAFEAALADHAAAGDGFETAHTRMLYGARLRREGQRVEAREQLAPARDAFARMGLTHWARVADHELAATGATARRRGVRTEEPLTSQETRVALLVAEGKSNKEVAAALFLSPKTIEHHLGSVFRKRGYRTRSELTLALAREQQSGR